MPKYIAHRDTWLSHESRKILASEEFSTTFPEVKVNGKLVPMTLGDNIELIESPETPAKGKGKGGNTSADADTHLV